MTEVTNINKPQSRTLTRITWFTAGIVFSSAMLYAAPQTGPMATNAVSAVVTNAPVVASNAAATVSGWVSNIGAE